MSCSAVTGKAAKPNQQREEDIKLFFDTQGPGVGKGV